MSDQRGGRPFDDDADDVRRDDDFEPETDEGVDAAARALDPDVDGLSDDQLFADDAAELRREAEQSIVAGREVDDENYFEREGDAVYQALLARVGEQAPQPRLSATRRVVELLGDPQRAYAIVHVTGTNGKTSTSRITESILRATGLRTGLFTSPHLVRFNERIVVDGLPITDEALSRNWADVEPFIDLVDQELVAAGEEPVTFFEALTVLAFASFADAPVDVAVIEVGMGGEWDSTNVGDGQVAVFTPVSLDHTQRLGSTVAEIARTKSGIVKPAADVVSSAQDPEVVAELMRAAELTESTWSMEGERFRLLDTTLAVGGQVISVQGLAGTYRDVFLPLFGAHQAQNAAVAIAAVESFLGGGDHAIHDDVLAEGLATATSPGRLQVVGTEPTVLVDAAHNPAGAASLAAALPVYFTFDRVTAVIGVLADKDAEGIVRELAPVVDHFIVTRSTSERSVDPDELARIVVGVVGRDRVTVEPDLRTALEDARDSAGETEKGAALVTGSILLVGEAIAHAADEGWKTA
ncbi:bifunctional folylpolyglutamate synthase/dihydrofolate synthase [Clavibacter michiganensis subsp. phaseoli]|jgi:dihydrofolate synthase/folylpolyglutamate synthase|uniref:bifunctional folylpolyglutamate synthase/dihydrofolate synthase n=1 Tax=Clavibacter phaseoli TaxID=1734031 RepID=UPI001FB29E58|nr:folylpolyglutamate synthase/dihydrofolate synthase family protein [Clavibacter phaseoli]MCJ1710928.1 bifunctional folylpolyglutamate synthase/dihydrofolate synthase [Clavibacter phaseoli]